MKLDKSIAAIVTGGASGLGEATARRLARSGVKVALLDLNAELGDALAREIGGVFCQADVTSEEQVEAGFARARAVHGQERVLVNCAGSGKAAKTASRDKLTGEIRPHPIEQFERIVQINLVGSFRCIVHSVSGMLTLPKLEGGECGVVVNTASVAAEDGQMGQAAYAASKAGVVGMTLPIARDMGSEGIRINTIQPGIFDTPLLRGGSEKVLAGLFESVPFPKRTGQPDEFARLVETLIDVSYFNGACIRLDGGIRMAPR